MDLRYEMYLTPNYKFYKRAGEANKKKTLLHVENLPEGWYSKIDKEKHWHYCGPFGIPIPPQGWKIHISSTLENTQKTLDIVSNILISRNTHFKFVMSTWDLFVKNSKYGDRSASGKFITIYPATDYLFYTLLDELNEALSGLENGAYILNDNRWFFGNVYFRYGGFLEMHTREGQSGIINEYGEIIPDQRIPGYVVPSFVEVPEKLKLMELEKESRSLDASRLDAYNIYEALHFSNGGGVYKATIISSGKKVIIKEGRPEAGLDSTGKDGFKRLSTEFDTLSKLSEVDEVVDVYEYFKAWENVYLVEEVVNGIPLQSWIAQHYPFNGSEEKKQTYLHKVLDITEKIKIGLQKIHNKHIGIGDLSPSNILINNDTLEIKFIDFETAGPINDEYSPSLATPGFVSKYSKTRKQSDWYSFYRIVYSMLVPIAPIQDIEIKNERKMDKWILITFGRDAYDYVTTLKKLLPLAKSMYNSDNQDNHQEYDLENLILKVRQGIVSHLQPRKKQLIPGDIRQFEYQGGIYNVLTGGFGVVMSLIRTGKTPPSIKEWALRYSKEKYLSELDYGLFSGKSGIACILFELGEIQRSKEIIDSINISDETSDITIMTGLSGIGLAFLSFYSSLNDTAYLEKAINVAGIIKKVFSSNVDIYSKDPDFFSKGLFDGWSGATIFFNALYTVTRNKEWLNYAEDMMSRELDSCTLDDEGILHIEDEQRLLPYLAGGGVGVAIALLSLAKQTNNEFYFKKFEQTLPLSSTICCYNSGLFRGYAGFLLFSSLIEQEYGIIDEKKTLTLLNTMQMYVIDTGQEVMLPGDYGYRLSGDLFSGASGVLLALEAIRGRSWKNWFPLIPETLDLLF